MTTASGRVAFEDDSSLDKSSQKGAIVVDDTDAEVDEAARRVRRGGLSSLARRAEDAVARTPTMARREAARSMALRALRRASEGNDEDNVSLATQVY